MQDHSGVLQERVKVHAVGRRGDQALERTRKKQDQNQESSHHGRLNADEIRHRDRMRAPMPRHGGRREDGHEPDPEEERPFVASPDGGDLVENGKNPVGVRGDVLDGEVVRQKSVDERRDGEREKNTNGPRRRGTPRAPRRDFSARRRKPRPCRRRRKRAPEWRRNDRLQRTIFSPSRSAFFPSPRRGKVRMGVD